MKKYKYGTVAAIGHRRTPKFFSINVGAVFMAKKNWMRPGGFCVGAPMANFV